MSRNSDVLHNRSVRMAKFTSERAVELSEESGVPIYVIYGAAIALFNPKHNSEHAKAVEDFESRLEAEKLKLQIPTMNEEDKAKLLELLQK